MLIIGITGTLGAGKGTVVEYLTEKKGFHHYSVRSYLLGEIRRVGLPENRDSMVVVANDLRGKHSPSFVTDQLYREAVEKGENCIIESIRTPGEITSLRAKGNFHLIAVDARPEIRYERIVARQSETDHISYQTFLENEAREMTSTDPNKQNLQACIREADFLLTNNGSRQELFIQAENILHENLEKGSYNCTPPPTPMESETYARPTWDEYFMEIAHAISKRATCDRGRSGCVIARDKQILVTGYVGSPRGLPHCDDIGHLMKKVLHEDERITQHCVRTVHAEQNAICQAARLGIPLDKATLYCRMTPCRTCAMLIINCGIERVICERKYHDGQESEEMFRQAGVQLEYVFDEIQKYEKQ